jgi:ubiquinone biosynthesis protein COQ4
MMSSGTEKLRMQPRVAWKALQTLIANPEDTAQVFKIIRAMSGPSLQQGFERFITLPFGRRVIEEKLDLLSTLQDREALRAMPEGSLGRAYLEFVESENLSADGLVEASAAEDENYQNAWLQRYGLRLRDMHDLWHTATQYGRDELGELCLLAFSYAQTRNRGIGLIVLFGMLKMRKTLGNRVIGATWRGYRDGRRAAWLPGQNWEALLSRPLADVRSELGIGEPVAYQAVRQQLITA